jgi:hypothetical protein
VLNIVVSKYSFTYLALLHLLFPQTRFLNGNRGGHIAYAAYYCGKAECGVPYSGAVGATNRKDGYLTGSGFTVSWCIGHLVEMKRADAYDERYAKWRYEDLPIIPESFKCGVPKDKAGQFGVL